MKIEKLLKYFRNYAVTHYTNLAIKQQLETTVLTATDQKPNAKIIYKVSASQHHVDIRVGN